MKLIITEAALKKIQAIQQPGDQLILDLDDGIGAFSSKLLENGLKYRLLAVPAGQVTPDFTGSVSSAAGLIKYTAETDRYLDQQMTISYRPLYATCQLSSDQALLEPDLVIQHVTAMKSVKMS